MASKVLLILGYGANIGGKTASKFASQGYKVAIAARSVEAGLSKDTGYYGVKADFSQEDRISSVFETVEKELGTPNVVLYNAAGSHGGKPDDPLAPSLVDFRNDIHINFVSLIAAAQEAVRGFKTLPASSPKVFLYTGNKFNDPKAAPASFLSLSVGKGAASFLIEKAAGSYAKEGIRFYYVDERTADGSPAYSKIDGEAHAEEFWKLAHEKDQLPWQYTFAKGKGYIAFEN